MFAPLPSAPSMVGLPIFMDGGPQSMRYPNKAWNAYMNQALKLRGYSAIESCQERLNTPANAFVMGCQGKLQLVGSMYSGYAAHMNSLTDPEPRRYSWNDGSASRKSTRGLGAYKARLAEENSTPRR
ncbi:hypothetical protein [Microvirga tunisiensis]|uniref:Uncharacterized protein n=1 Tax=Microvirga tunisiensis TaxID=2108360 RepID=A0A5N7MBK0_9HYPH|nr:hypothetical protein [Microvirga tunisiensis]MPR08150.1 hypothetical protein [Microvirga tunisiensis]MPR24137.1 hypothetical protein [Microvirga tunisiensis]